MGKAHDAMRKAEKSQKAKTDKLQEIKKLNQQKQIIQSDMSKLKEQLEDCEKYKKFLDSLTPDEYFEEQTKIKVARQEDRLKARRKARMAQWDAAKAKAIADAEAREQAEKERLEREGRVRKRRDGDSNQEIILPPKPNFDDDVLTSSGEELPMYFKDPQQLLDIFTALEESNLFLIQNSQETEQALEELKQNLNETKRKMNRKTAAQKQNIDSLRAQIAIEETKAESLNQRSKAATGENKQEELLEQLHETVKDVYRKCQFDADSNPSTLFMLTDLEARLEDLLSAIEKMPVEYVLKAEKEKEKDRRERVRQERMAQQQKMYEERMKKSMQRSMQAPKKRKGRQVMWRSQPMRKAVQAERKTDDGADDDADAVYFQ